MEGFSAGASVLRIRVINGESLTLNRVSEVDRRPIEVGNGHAVNNDLNAVEVTEGIAVEEAIIEVELVDRASPIRCHVASGDEMPA